MAVITGARASDQQPIPYSNSACAQVEERSGVSRARRGRRARDSMHELKCRSLVAAMQRQRATKCRP